MIKAQLSVSLDGFVAGPDQGPDAPLGVGGMDLHQWVFATDSWREQHGLSGGERNVDAEIAEQVMANIGAVVMGRKMFGGGDGEWDPAWKGWWGEDPPYHCPVFVLTHREREPLEMAGGTTFNFVTNGFDAALSQALEAAGESDVSIAGGASTVNQAIAAGRLDELYLHQVPILLGAGERLFVDVGSPDGIEIEQSEVIASDRVTHIRYRFPR